MALGGTVPLVVVGAFARVVAGSNVSLGSLPAWISAGGALFTAGGELLALHSYRSAHRADLKEQANQVRLLRPAVLPCGKKGDKLRWTTEFVNKSDGLLYSTTVHGVGASATVGTPAAPMRPIDEISSTTPAATTR
ncbi:hypothetical protein HQO38_18830 [Rhodococcus fascians]|nr:hypothetical protein [Rhodococcus fascians]MBY4140514.1 hypothetical protein [Rhodococcus fascians]MBY4219018.1 hypothetical protein [Rhodococcus fascians]MBY4221970.1 hypothetical protein [Rhodococcus fascians]MBY4233971.1 hypothetical protein [Rhodococcus fascians]